MIPRGITHEHLMSALSEIDEHGVRPGRESTKYDFLYQGEKYPPKYVISIAYKYAEGKEWPAHKFNAVEAKDHLIRRGYTIVDKQFHVEPAEEDEESNFAEGKERYAIHRRLERDSIIAIKVKSDRLARLGELRCEVCGFSFEGTYGPEGAGYMEAHHTVPVSELSGERKTKHSEIALVCSNCHRMLHRTRPWLTITDLKQVVQDHESKAGAT